MAGGDDEVFAQARAPQVGQSVRRTGAKAMPGFDLCEIFHLEIGIIACQSLDDSLNAFGADHLIDAGDFHGATNAQGTIHRRDGHTGFSEDGANGRKLRWLAKGQAVALAGL